MPIHPGRTKPVPSANQPPVARLLVSNTNVSVGVPVRVDASTSSDPDGRIKRWTLAWGDGATMQGNGHPYIYEHPYAALDTYTITLTVVDQKNISDTAHRTVSVVAQQRPRAVLSYGSVGSTTEDSYQVLTTGTLDPDGTIVSGTLDWDDGQTVEFTGTPATSYSHNYVEAGTYSVTLTVIDNDDLEATANLPITVNPVVEPPQPPPDPINQPPIAVLTYVSGQYATQPYVVGTTGTQDPEGDLGAGSIDWGDSSSDTTWTGTPPVTASHTYATSGTRTITLTVADGDGLTSVATRQAVITDLPAANLPPIVHLVQTAGSLLGDTFTVSTSGTSDPDGTLVSGTLNWGDGTVISITGNPATTYSRVYTTPGTKTVTLTMVDDDLTSGAATIVIGVANGSTDWPRPDAPWTAVVQKTAGFEMTDPVWAHLHQGHGGEESFTVETGIFNQNSFMANNPATEVRYTVRGTAISGWLPLPASLTITLATSGLPAQDGIHDLSVEVRGANASLIKPYPMFLHLGRHTTESASVPIMAQNRQALDNLMAFPYATAYAVTADRDFVGYPSDPDPNPWAAAPHSADLYQEPMSVRSDLFEGVQMWWQEPVGSISEDVRWVRALQPKFSEYFIGLYNNNGAVGNNDFGYGGLRNLPSKDGPRGVGWTSGYVGGQVDSLGGFAHVHKTGAVRYMTPDGEFITVAGWRVHPDHDPVWMLKPLSQIRARMQFLGTWTNGTYADPYDPGFHQPMDLAIDPLNEDIWYVAGMYDHCIWKLVVNRSTWTATVSVFAGDVNHSSGYVNATGTSARFNKPFSLVFDPVSDCLYVSDFNNDAIRKITRAGVVTTVFGATGFATMLSELPGNLTQFDERIVAVPTVAFDHATMEGADPDIFCPYTIRADSTGRLILFDRGFNTVRRFDLGTMEAEILIRLEQSNDGGQSWFFTGGGLGPWVRGWAWLDVDRYGNSGPLDSIYLGLAVTYALPRNETSAHFNEEYWWIAPDGSQQTYISSVDLQPMPASWGPMNKTDLPHYPWAIAVDPRGGLYLAGIGEHGIAKIRKRRVTDPMPPSDIDQYYDGTNIWKIGSADYPYYTIPRTANGWGLAPALQHGWEAHNMLGYADAWATESMTDNQIIAAFHLPTQITSNTTALARVLSWIRLNRVPAS